MGLSKQPLPGFYNFAGAQTKRERFMQEFERYDEDAERDSATSRH
jgi:hypothetical protein